MAGACATGASQLPAATASAIMSKALTKEDSALLEKAGKIFDETSLRAWKCLLKRK